MEHILNYLRHMPIYLPIIVTIKKKFIYYHLLRDRLLRGQSGSKSSIKRIYKPGEFENIFEKSLKYIYKEDWRRTIVQYAISSLKIIKNHNVAILLIPIK